MNTSNTPPSFGAPLPPPDGWGWSVDPARRAALTEEWLAFLRLVERGYARWAAVWGLAVAPLGEEERWTAATLAASTGLRPSPTLARWLGWWDWA